MKKSFRKIVCCLLGASVLSAGASHVRSKSKTALHPLESWDVNKGEKTLLVSAKDCSCRHVQVTVDHGRVRVVIGNMEDPGPHDRKKDLRAPDEADSIIGPTADFVVEGDDELYVVGVENSRGHYYAG